jgi:hypothetical protein
LQDHFRLDSLKRINESTCVGEICNEAQKLIDAGVADEAFLVDVLKALWRVMDVEAQGIEDTAWLPRWRNLVRANGMDTVLDFLCVVRFCYTQRVHFPNTNIS